MSCRTSAVLIALLSSASAAALDVRIVSSVDSSKAAPNLQEKVVRQGEGVTLFAVVSGAGLPLTASVPEVLLDARSARKTQAPEGDWKIDWFRIEPTDHYLSNTEPTFHWQEIHYEYVPIEACKDRFSCPAQNHTKVLDDHGGLGTMTYRVQVRHGTQSGESAGAAPLYRGGLLPGLPRVTVRRDDTYLGYLTELFNTPYIWASAGDPSTVHQAERRIGSDCADFVTYGVRRLGHDIPYTSTWGLPKYTRQLYASTGPSADGTYLDAKGQPIPFSAKGVRPGDLMLFPGHVAAVLRDAPPLGVLSESDLMIHTSWHEPTEQSIASSDYRGKPVKVVRWKVFDK